MKIILAGPPRSGKSCLREGLKQAISAIPCAPYPYVITACPDGEGAWFQETVNNDPELAAAVQGGLQSQVHAGIRRAHQDFGREVLARADARRHRRLITSVENEAICSGATHIVVLAGDTKKFRSGANLPRKSV